MSQVVVVSKDADGKAQLVSTIARDISESKEIERVKSEFVSTVSHELRTPLTSIRGSLGLLASGALGDLPEKAQQMVDLGLSNTERLVRLVNNILDFERAQVGRLDMTVTEIDPVAVAVSARDAVEGAAREVGIAIELDTPTATLDPVHGDADRLVQVLVNLLGNAVKFSPPNGTVVLAVSQRPAGTSFEVTDSGPGIPSDQLATIFEPFHQVDSSDTRAVGGTGLGLAIAKSITSAHDGTITVESTLGVGSSFCVVLPGPVAAAAAAPSAGMVADGTHDRPDVLLVDPDLSTRIVISQLLAENGLSCAEAMGGWAAISRVQQLKPRVLMLDVSLPDLDGFGVLEQLRALGYGDLPLIIYADCDLRPEDRDRLSLGPSRHLVKTAVGEQQLIDEVIEMLSSDQIGSVRRPT